MIDLSIKIAETTVPDEIDLAPLITYAFIKGGKEKEALFMKQESAGLGAFGIIESILLFPYILKGLVVTAPLMPHFLSLDENYLDKTYHLLRIYHSQSMLDKQETKNESNQLHEIDMKQLKSLYETFFSEIKASGLNEEQCNKIFENVFKTLRKNSPNSLKFIEKLAAAK